MAPKSKKNASKFASKCEAENHPKMEPKWRQHGAKMKPKSHSKINVFWLGFWKPLETLAGLRRGCDGAAGGLRGGGCGCHTFSSRPPRAAPYYQGLLYKNKQRALLTGSSTPRAVGSANFDVILRLSEALVFFRASGDIFLRSFLLVF